MNSRQSFPYREPEVKSTQPIDQFLPEDAPHRLEDARHRLEDDRHRLKDDRHRLEDERHRLEDDRHGLEPTGAGWLRRVRIHLTILGAAVCVGALWALIVLWVRSTASGAETSTGLLKIQSEPGDATVFVDGRASGTTPVSLTLPSGTHRLLLRRGGRSQELSVTVSQNLSIVHHFTWPSEQVNAIPTGSLRVTAEGPAGAVSVDRLRRGSTPLTVSNLTAGDHEVVIVRDGTTYHRTIRVEPGTTASLVIGSRIPAGVESGWLAASADAPLQIFEDGKLVGSTASERILMPVGEHMFEFSDAALGFRVSRTVNILAGGTQNVAIELPQAPISINATPWAQVWLDGRSLGETPMGNLTATIGSHEVVLRHPQLGERRVTALVTMKEPVRIAVDMRRSQ